MTPIAARLHTGFTKGGEPINEPVVVLAFIPSSLGSVVAVIATADGSLRDTELSALEWASQAEDWPLYPFADDRS